MMGLDLDIENMTTEEVVAAVQEFNDKRLAAPSAVLKQLCDMYGYGWVMQEASNLWLEINPVGALLVGTCKGLTEPCGCDEPHKCDWCCGSGWLTKHVKLIKDKS